MAQEENTAVKTHTDGGRPRRRRRGGPRRRGEKPDGQSRRAPRMAVVSPGTGKAQIWAHRIEEYLGERHKTPFRLEVAGTAGLTDIIKEARQRGAQRILAVGDAEFVRWCAQAMVGSLMPLAPAIIPGSKPIFGHRPLTGASWQASIENLLMGRFAKIDLAMGTVSPFVHELVAGFPIHRPGSAWKPVHALLASEPMELTIQVDRSTIEGEFWCLVIANGDFPENEVRWLHGASFTDQTLDLLAVRPRSLWERFKFLRALRRGAHGAQPGVIRFRGHRITVQATRPWRYSADGGPPLDAANPLVLEAKPQQLRLVEPDSR